MKRKRISSMLALTIAMTSMPFNVFAGDARPPEGDAKRGENQPATIGYTAVDMEKWSPSTDPYSDLLTAKIPLQERNTPFGPTQANPNLSPETEFYNLIGDYSNYFFGGEPYNNEFSQYVYNFWQYADYYGGWHGTTTKDVPFKLFDPDAPWWTRAFEFGIVNLPNPAYTNAAHKNGVKSVGCLFIPRAGQPYADLLKRDSKGEFVIAKKLIEMKEYYGFDGYFINQETSIDSKHITEYKEFTKMLVDAGVYVQWYDTVDDRSGTLSYQASLVPSHSSYIKDDNLGMVNNSVFMNYNWNSKDGWNNGDSKDQRYIKATVNEANRRGIDPLETVFSGVEAGAGRFGGSHNSTRNMDVILDTKTGSPMTSIATLGGDFVATGLDEDLDGKEENRRGKDDYQWMIAERERMWYTGVKIDPTDTAEQAGYSRTDVGVKDASQWTGISRYITERSVIDGTVFATNFNTGHGMEYYSDGKVSNAKEWSNIGIQDILPTWQWWVDTQGTKLQVDFDYGDKVEKGEKFKYEQIGAYKGGSSLVVNGLLDANNCLRLYKTNLNVCDNSSASITFNKVSETDESTMSLGLIFEDYPQKVETVKIPNTNKQTKGFITEKVDLSKYEGRNIAAMGLVFAPGTQPIQNYQMNIGEIKITDGENYTPAKPTGFKLKDVFNTNEAYVTWKIADYATVKQYNVYAQLDNGNEEFLGGVYDAIYYIKNLNPDTVKLKLRAVGEDGTESDAAEIDFKGSNYIQKVDVVETDKGLNVSWENPSIAFKDIKLELSFTDGRKDVYTKKVDSATTAVSFIVPVKDDDNYMLKLSTQDRFGRSLYTTSVTGKMKDIYSQPYDGKYNSGSGYGSMLSFENPTSEDWWHMYVYINDQLQRPSKKFNEKICDYRIRGFHDMNDIKAPKVGDEIKVVLEDYAGNMSAPTIFTYGDDKDLEIVGVDPVTLETGVGVEPLLPQKVTATYMPISQKNLLAVQSTTDSAIEVTTSSVLKTTVPMLKATPSYKKEEVAVVWDAIPKENYSKLGTFDVQGTVEGTTLKAVCTINVVDVVALTAKDIEKTQKGTVKVEESIFAFIVNEASGSATIRGERFK
ncbi:MAG: Ig-like domain-containing protein [Cellulosilyticaceae bacterium]